MLPRILQRQILVCNLQVGMLLSTLITLTSPARHSTLLRLCKHCNRTVTERSVHHLAAAKGASHREYWGHRCTSISGSCQKSLDLQWKRHHSADHGQVRVRFAPSPTGEPPIFHLHNALSTFNIKAINSS